MAEVKVDGEEVVFEGEPPSDLGQLFDLLMGAMSERGRAVVSFRVDGVDLMSSPGESSLPETFEKIEASTLTHAEITLQLIERVENETSSLSDELVAYSQRILLLGWTEIFRRMDEFISKIQPIADLLDNLGPFAQTYDPPWRNAFTDLQRNQGQALEQALACFQIGDSAGLSDVVADSFNAVLADFRKLSDKEMKPYLRLEMKQAE